MLIILVLSYTHLIFVVSNYLIKNELDKNINLPFTFRCSDPVVSDKTKYPTFTRMEPPDTQVCLLPFPPRAPLHLVSIIWLLDSFYLEIDSLLKSCSLLKPILNSFLSFPRGARKYLKYFKNRFCLLEFCKVKCSSTQQSEANFIQILGDQERAGPAQVPQVVQVHHRGPEDGAVPHYCRGPQEAGLQEGRVHCEEIF